MLKGDIKWDIGANLYHTRTKILSLANEQDQFIDPFNNRILHKIVSACICFTCLIMPV